MTTDVINGVPRSLLEQVAIELEHDNDRYMLGRELRKLLATAQPAADGEREARRVLLLTSYCDESGCKDGAPCVECLRMCNVAMVSGDVSVVGQYDQLPGCCLTAQPQQAVAVTDEVRRLREALK